MCGIFGWNLTRKNGLDAGKRVVMASTLAVANSLRGDQSWGAYFKPRKGGAEVVKAVGDVADYDGIGLWGSQDTFFGHTRWATTGILTKENAHPFTVKDVTLAHNGMVFNHDDLDRLHGRQCAVDSMHLAHHVAEGRPFTDCEGYGAVEFVKANRPRVIYLCRMRGGSLHVYGLKNGGKNAGVVWSSDEAHLKSAIGAARLDAFPFKPLAEGKVYEARDGYLYESSHPDLAIQEGRWSDDAMKRWQRATSGGARGVTHHSRGVKVGYRTGGKAGVYYLDPQGKVTDKDDPTGVEVGGADDEAWVERWYERQDIEGAATRAAIRAGHKAAEDAGLTALDSARGLYVNAAGEIVEIDAHTGVMKPTGDKLPDLPVVGDDPTDEGDADDIYSLTEEEWLARETAKLDGNPMHWD